MAGGLGCLLRVHLVWQMRRLDIGDPALCLRIFKSNRDAGLLLFAGLFGDAVMRSGSVGWVAKRNRHMRCRHCEEPTGSRQCAPDDRLRDEAIHSSFCGPDGCFAEPGRHPFGSVKVRMLPVRSRLANRCNQGDDRRAGSRRPLARSLDGEGCSGPA